MARDLQEATAAVKLIPFDGPPENIRLMQGGPFAQVVHNDVLIVDGSGVGDTADLRLTLPLPGNHVYVLEAFALWGFSTNGVTQFDNGLLETYYSPLPAKDTTGGGTVQQNFQVHGSNNLSIISTSNARMWQLGMTAGTYNQDYSGVNSVDRLVLYGNEAGGTDPVLWLSAGPDTAVPGEVLDYAIVWLAFTVDQFFQSPMYQRLPVR